MSPTDWSPAEVSLIVADYFAMLAQELRNEPFRKTEHRRSLSPLLNGRSDGSIEFKHQNISAVLVRMGLQDINGSLSRAGSQGFVAAAMRGEGSGRRLMNWVGRERG